MDKVFGKPRRYDNPMAAYRSGKQQVGRCRMEYNVKISPEQLQKIVTKFYNSYPNLKRYMEARKNERR